MIKKCFRCKHRKSLSRFHKDRTNKDGYASSCIECRSTKKSKFISVKPIKIKITHEEAQIDTVKELHKSSVATTLPFPHIPLQKINLLTQLLEKLGHTFTITVQKNKKSFIQVHSTPSLAYRAETPEELLTKILG
jgi:hypothetical protein